VTSAWRVHLPTVNETGVRVRCAPYHQGAPWPLSRAIVDLGRMGVRPTERFRSLGAGHGQPLIHSQEAEWRGLAVHLEAIADRTGTVESTLALPSMDEILRAGVEESEWWGLVDAFCAAVDALHGAIVDDEAVELEAPADRLAWGRRLSDHLGLLVPEDVELPWRPYAEAYTTLPLSRLTVVLR
jgi:hypothetical protein